MEPCWWGLAVPLESWLLEGLHLCPQTQLELVPSCLGWSRGCHCLGLGVWCPSSSLSLCLLLRERIWSSGSWEQAFSNCYSSVTLPVLNSASGPVLHSTAGPPALFIWLLPPLFTTTIILLSVFSPYFFLSDCSKTNLALSLPPSLKSYSNFPPFPIGVLSQFFCICKCYRYFCGICFPSTIFD